MPPVISIVGRSKVGKTTYIEKLIAELRARGYRVATIKHAPHGIDFNDRGRDTWRHLNAGSEITAGSSPERVVLVKPVKQDLPLEEVARLLGEDCDIILAEGFKQGSAPKIEVHRREVGPPLSAVRKRIAIATDEPLEINTRQFTLSEVKGIADFLEAGFIKPQQERISLYVDNVPIVLTKFPRKIFTSVITAMVSSLKGVGKASSINISLRR